MEMHVKFVGTHNTESSDCKLSAFVIDKTLAVDAGSIPSELSFAEQQAIKGILLSHGHYDHIRGIPAFAQASAKSGFSERKPYPGWIASAFVRSAASSTFLISR